MQTALNVTVDGNLFGGVINASPGVEVISIAYLVVMVSLYSKTYSGTVTNSTSLSFVGARSTTNVLKC